MFDLEDPEWGRTLNGVVVDLMMEAETFEPFTFSFGISVVSAVFGKGRAVAKGTHLVKARLRGRLRRLLFLRHTACLHEVLQNISRRGAK